MRYLKRGLNSEGACANDVETEQIVQDISYGDVNGHAHLSSYVQVRFCVYWCVVGFSGLYSVNVLRGGIGPWEHSIVLVAGAPKHRTETPYLNGQERPLL